MATLEAQRKNKKTRKDWAKRRQFWRSFAWIAWSGWFARGTRGTRGARGAKEDKGDRGKQGSERHAHETSIS